MFAFVSVLAAARGGGAFLTRRNRAGKWARVGDSGAGPAEPCRGPTKPSVPARRMEEGLSDKFV